MKKILSIVCLLLSLWASAQNEQLANNYFDLNLQATDADFISLDENLLTAPRKADGSLPDIDFMQLKSTSQFIDKGKMIGFSFKGMAPDLGAFEVNK